MRIVLTGRNVEITPQLRQLIDRRLSRLDRLLNDSVVSAQIVLALEKHRHLSEITVHARGDHMLHGLGDAPGWQASLGEAVEKITQQGHKLKDKWEKRKRRAEGARGFTGEQPVAPARPAANQRRVVRAANYAVKPMTVEDAAKHLDMLRVDVVMFVNQETNQASVVFRQQDGNIGFTEPTAK